MGVARFSVIQSVCRPKWGLEIIRFPIYWWSTHRVIPWPDHRNDLDEFDNVRYVELADVDVDECLCEYSFLLFPEP